MKIIEQAIQHRESRITALQAEVSQLRSVQTLLAQSEAATPKAPGGKARRRIEGKPASKPAPPTPPPANAERLTLPSDKPNTIPGAIKHLLRDENVGSSFTRELLTENLRADADFKRIYEANVEGSEKSIDNALRNWTFAERLKKDGANYTLTAAGKEWFNT